MHIWFTDLDNTLIYSYKHEIPLPKTTAEFYQDREQSYLTERTRQFCTAFCRQPDQWFVPLTTRIQSQYERILLREWLPYRYALIHNGAVLLDYGVPDETWLRESLTMAADCAAPLMAALADLHTIAEEAHVHDVRPYMVYAVSEQVTPAFVETLRQCYEPQGLSVMHSGRKLYCLPQVFSKGNAVRRFCERFAARTDIVIASGDSVFDLSMLAESDLALYPQTLTVPAVKGRRFPISGFFADGLCTVLEQELQNAPENNCK